MSTPTIPQHWQPPWTPLNINPPADAHWYFNPPPGWPKPINGWRPPPGWQPPINWPPAPERHHYWRQVPAWWPVALWTAVIAGLFGIIIAAWSASRARRALLPTWPYWAAWAATYSVQVIILIWLAVT